MIINKPSVTKYGILDMQVCIPKEWDDDKVIEFAEQEFPCGTQHGWSIRKQGSKYLSGTNERVPCSEDPINYVHIMLDA